MNYSWAIFNYLWLNFIYSGAYTIFQFLYFTVDLKFSEWSLRVLGGFWVDKSSMSSLFSPLRTVWKKFVIVLTFEFSFVLFLPSLVLIVLSFFSIYYKRIYGLEYSCGIVIIFLNLFYETKWQYLFKVTLDAHAQLRLPDEWRISLYCSKYSIANSNIQNSDIFSYKREKITVSLQFRAFKRLLSFLTLIVWAAHNGKGKVLMYWFF